MVLKWLDNEIIKNREFNIKHNTDRKINKVINTNECVLCHIIEWNNKYAIVADYNNKSFKIIDIEEGKIIINIPNRRSNVVISAPTKAQYNLFKQSVTGFQKLVALSNGENYYIKDIKPLEDGILLIIQQIEIEARKKEEELLKFISSNKDLSDSHKYQSSILIKIKASRSDFLKKLLERQDEEFDIIETQECCSYVTSQTVHMEQAYIFTIQKSNGWLYIVYENNNDATSSIICSSNELNDLNIKCAYIGTIGFYYGNVKKELNNTTPDIDLIYEKAEIESNINRVRELNLLPFFILAYSK